jgi:hypothetical protein
MARSTGKRIEELLGVSGGFGKGRLPPEHEAALRADLVRVLARLDHVPTQDEVEEHIARLTQARGAG